MDFFTQPASKKAFFDCTRSEIEQYHCRSCSTFQTSCLTYLKHHNKDHSYTNPEDTEYKCQNCAFTTYSQYLRLRHHKSQKHDFLAAKTPKKVNRCTRTCRPFKSPKKPLPKKNATSDPSLVCNSSSGGCKNSVDSIIKVNFSSLDLKSKIAIKKLGRPTPILKLSQTCTKKKEGRSFTRHFTSNIYTRNKWICGCNVRNSLFCFPCLLFFTPNMDKNWSRVGVTDLNHLHERIKKHDVSKAHLEASTDFALLGKINIAQQLSSEYRQQIAKHNEEVKKNRHILRRIISCVKLCGVFELALRGHDEREESLNRGIFKELIDFSAELDIVLKEQLATSSVFTKTSKTIQNDILDCMLSVCRSEILNEIADADFLSIQCDEISDVSNHCQMVLILRYVNGHTICERFWTFLRITDKTADGLVKSIQQEIDPMIKNPKKLIAQTYDGASVMSNSVGGVQAKMREKYPHAYFVHCYSHQLNLIMQKAAGQNPQARIFFCDLSGIPAFFSNSSHRSNTLEQIVKTRLPRVAPTQWNFNIQLVNTVYENRENLILCFQEITIKVENTITAREANDLRRTLEDRDFMFWLTFFHRILPHVDLLYSQFQSRQIDSVQVQEAISEFVESVLSIRDKTEAIEHEWQSETVSERTRLDETDKKSVCAKEICDVIVTQTKDRLSFRGHLEANKLLINDLYKSFNKTFPREIFDKVTKVYPMLVKERLKTELELIYSRSEFSQVYGAKSTLEFILKNDLDSTFSEVVKLLKIVMTTPMHTAEAERCFSTLKRVKTFLRNSMSNSRLNALAMMSINKEFVHDIPHFEEKVLEKFVALKNRRSDFSFKE